jgi:hypothetical protein
MQFRTVNLMGARGKLPNELYGKCIPRDIQVVIGGRAEIINALSSVVNTIILKDEALRSKPQQGESPVLPGVKKTSVVIATEETEQSATEQAEQKAKEQAKEHNNRSRQVCVELKWFNKDGTLNDEAPDSVKNVYPGDPNVLRV